MEPASMAMSKERGNARFRQNAWRHLPGKSSVAHDASLAYFLLHCYQKNTTSGVNDDREKWILTPY